LQKLLLAKNEVQPVSAAEPGETLAGMVLAGRAIKVQEVL
jgi:hypothetical protein